MSHWAYDAQSVAERNHLGETEEKFIARWNEQLRDKFEMEGHNLQVVFIDSSSQQPRNLQDPQQQEAFQRETGKLWTFSRDHDAFPFRTIQDVLNENQAMKKEIKWLNDVVVHNISELTNQISALSEKHEEDIEAVNEDIQDVAEDITTLTTDISNLAMAPIGTIIAWSNIPNKLLLAVCCE